MNKNLVLFSLLIVFSQVMYASTYQMYNCETKLIFFEGKYYKPPSNMKKIEVGISRSMDNATLRTQNYQSFFTYKTIINDKHMGEGIRYQSDNIRFIDFFKNGYIFLGSVSNGVDLKAYCKEIKLNLFE